MTCSTSLLFLLPGCFPEIKNIQLNGQEDSAVDTDSGFPETGDTSGCVPDETASDTGRPTDSGPDTGGETGDDTGRPAETGADTSVDTDPPCTELVWYADMDGDGYGQVGLTEWACDQPTGYVSQAGDYDDADVSIHWSGCSQTLAEVGLEADLRLEEWDDLTLKISLSEATQYALVYWYDSAAPRGYWISCGEVGGLNASMDVDSDTSVTEYYGNTYTEEASGDAEDWDQYLVTGAERSDGTLFEVSAYTTAAELVAVL